VFTNAAPGTSAEMRDRRSLARVVLASVLAIPLGALWASCGLAECDRADCGPVLSVLAVTSWFGLLLLLAGLVGVLASGVLLVVRRLRR
jgi:hypothetical protein